MAKNRYNSPPKGPTPDFTPRGQKPKEVEVTIDKEPCLICKKMCHAYGRHEEGHTCSAKCEKQYVKPEGGQDAQMVTCFNGRTFVPE